MMITSELGRILAVELKEKELKDYNYIFYRDSVDIDYMVLKRKKIRTGVSEQEVEKNLDVPDGRVIQVDEDENNKRDTERYEGKNDENKEENEENDANGFWSRYWPRE